MDTAPLAARAWRRALWLCAAAAVAVGVASASAAGAPATTRSNSIPYADPAWSSDGKRIAFVKQQVRESGGVYGALYVMNADGSGVRQLTGEEQGPGWPTWSPDSKRIAFVFYPRRPAPAPTIHVVGANGRGLRALVVGSYPDWSPGGRKIAYNSGILDTTVGDILIMNADGTLSTLVAEARGDTAYIHPTWSPDGERVAFVVVSAPDTGGSTLPYLVFIDDYFNGKVRELSSARAYEPDWAPDGRRIAYTHAKGERLTVRVLDLRRQRTWFVHDGSHPRWSPDGRQIVFVHGGQIHVMNADGSNVRQLTK